jgi:hypothetical protein
MTDEDRVLELIRRELELFIRAHGWPDDVVRDALLEVARNHLWKQGFWVRVKFAANIVGILGGVGAALAAVLALLTEGDASKAAAVAGVSRQSLYRWMKAPAFAAALRTAETEALRGLSRRLAGLGDAAADALQDALDEGQPIGIRLRAADLVTARGPALAEVTDLIERLEALYRRK